MVSNFTGILEFIFIPIFFLSNTDFISALQIEIVTDLIQT